MIQPPPDINLNLHFDTQSPTNETEDYTTAMSTFNCNFQLMSLWWYNSVLIILIWATCHQVCTPFDSHQCNMVLLTTFILASIDSNDSHCSELTVWLKMQVCKNIKMFPAWYSPEIIYHGLIDGLKTCLVPSPLLYLLYLARLSRTRELQ